MLARQEEALQGVKVVYSAGSTVEQVPHRQWLQKQVSKDRVPVGIASVVCHTH